MRIFLTFHILFLISVLIITSNAKHNSTTIDHLNISRALISQDEEIEIYTYDINTFVVIGNPPVPYNKRHKSKRHYNIYKRRHPIIYSKRQYYGDSENSTMSLASILKNGNWYFTVITLGILISSFL
ncbi:3110_t:CDS:1 [Cetraspora pellucida]|uniref:3110_t:CDS:1 n=1 Tax=Cetraspora pellucida TaxID=1433469 RepID=A0A9N9AK13_9GLOM|nr:3110_t:CDS:1 [Cetraspora pellucida]